MPDPSNQAATRYLVVVDPDADIDAVAADLQSSGISIAAKLDFIRTLVVTGNAAAVTTAETVNGVKSIEPEGTVRTQD